MDSSISPPRGASVTLYLPMIDGLRFIAFLLVFIYHYPCPETWTIIHAVGSRGWIGVEIFFAISAYLLYRLLALEDQATGTISLPDFYTRRVLRIFPLMLLFPIAMLVIFGPAGPFWAQRLVGLAVGLDNFFCWFVGFNHDVPFSDHLWTLPYELQLYAVLPLLFFAFRRRSKRRILVALLAIELFVLAARWAFATGDAYHPIIWVTPFLRPESTLLGIAIAIWRPDTPPVVTLPVLAASAIVLMVGPSGEQIGVWTVVIYLLTALVSSSMLLLTLNAKPLARLLSVAPIVYLGKISFGLYVYHLVAINLGINVINHVELFIPEGLRESARLALSLGIVIALAALSYRFIERPFLKLNSRLAVVASRPI